MVQRNGYQHVSRRHVLRVGGLTAWGLGLVDFFRLREAHASVNPPEARAKACILVWLDGGPSHLETFDPKPDAAEEVRGPLRTIPTRIAGIRVSECLERTAAMLEHFAIVRSMTSPLGEHNFGTHYLMTGHRPSPALEYPSMGATLAHIRAGRNAGGSDHCLPSHMAIPEFTNNITGNGFLPQSTAPFSVGGNPESADFKVRDLEFYTGLDLSRLSRRLQVVQALNEFDRSRASTGAMHADPNLQRAYNLITSPDAKAAFRLADESDDVRNRYGRHGGNGIGQSCLLARRLVERGVPFVTVHSGGWDTHQDILQLKERYPGDRGAHLPALDRALSALVQDLADRNMLQETLVVVMGEFGRTPRINSAGGRDHWPNVFSVALAGGGIQGGQIIGSSDALGEYPRENPVTPADLAATIYTLLGIDPGMELQTSDGRPVRVVSSEARIVSQMLA